MQRVVATSSGRISGTIERDVCVFRGIPYGASTAGAARFRPPSRPEPWAGTLECVRFGPSCPPTLTAADRAFFPTSPLWSVYAGLADGIPFGEDCLRLNVWTSSCQPSALQPVIVWMHGGGFSWGSGSSPLTSGDELARNHDVVVVTVNHRLGVLGYLHVPDGGREWADSGVAGLLDLRLALEWVHENIAAFGGDPNNVTIAGHSGGSAKVACLMALPSARGLFRRAIIMSGVVTLRSMTVDEATESTRNLLDAARLSSKDVGRLRELPFSELTALASGLRFRPVVGEPGMPEHPFDPVAAPSAAGLDMLVGVAKDDAATFKYDSDPRFATMDAGELLRRVTGLPGVGNEQKARHLVDEFQRKRPGADPRHLLVEITTQGLRERTALMAERQIQASGPSIWMYEFAYDIVMPPDTPFPGELMAPHGGELPFFFDIADKEWLAGDAADRAEFGHMVSSYLTNFARTGNPNGAGLEPWPAYDLATRHVRNLRPSND
jgi:para-nitrobenzyl esterase